MVDGERVERRDDIELVKGALCGDHQAFRVLVEKYQERSFALAYEILKSREDAEDVVQESFVKAYLSLADFRRQSAFYTWLYRIVYNMAIDFKRKLIRRGGQNVELDESERQAADFLGRRALGPDEALLHREKGWQIKQALDGLSDEHRAVVMLREIEGLSYDEIARVAGVSKGTVMSRLHYARRRLQNALGALIEEGGKGGKSSGDRRGQTGGQEDLQISSGRTADKELSLARAGVLSVAQVNP